MSERRKISANILWLLSEKVLRLAIGFLVIGLLARHLGPDEFGALNYSIGLTALFTAVATLGLDSIVVRELIRRPDQTEAILGTAFILRVTGAVVAIAALALIAPLVISNSPVLRPLVTITSLVFLWQAFDVIDLWFQRNLQSRHTVAAKILGLSAGTAVKLWLVAKSAPVAWFCWAFVLDGAFQAAALTIVFRSLGGRFGTWRFSLPVARILLEVAWPLITSGVLISVYLRLDQIIVLRLLGPHQLGFYTAATRIAELWVAVSGFVLMSIFPVLIARRERGEEFFQQDLQFAFDAMTGLGYAFAILVSLAAPVIVPAIFGETYRPAGRVLAVLVWSAPFLFSGGMRGHYFMLEGVTTYHNWAAVLGIAANASLAFWLIPNMGAPGAALAVALSAALSAWLSSFLFPRLRLCARLQTTALLLPLRPHAWFRLFRRLR